MRIIDLHCYPSTQEWIDCQGPYVEALAKYWKRDWSAKTEEEVIGEFTEFGVEAVLVALDLETTIGTPPCGNDYVAAHPGWPWIDDMTAVALHKGNVYWEMSGWAPKYLPDSVKRNIRGRLRDKIMFGSDYPSMPYERIFREWSEIGYTDDVLEDFYHGNAERVLGL